MNLEELCTLMAAGESERLEFKRSTGEDKEAAKVVCSMLNGNGGFVVFGITNAGEIAGQEISAQTMERLVGELRRIEPPAYPDIETIPLEQGTCVIALRVTGGGGPYTYDGRPYHRHGPTTSLMPRAEYERRLLERLHGIRRWENEPVAAGIDIVDLDADEIRRTVDNAVLQGRLDPPRSRDIASILRGLGLVIDDQLLNAAIVLYGSSRRLQAYYPQCSIRMARFRGGDRLAEFTDNRQYWGHAFDLLRRAEAFLLDHVPVAGRVRSGRLEREDRPLYPPRATREALANALCHRDYAIPGGAVALAMYDDHLEIANPGALHFGLTPEKLFQPHESRPWNPIIAQVLYRAGIIERWGAGTLNILQWCREWDRPAPWYEERAGSVVIAFSSPKTSAAPSREMAANEGRLGGRTTPQVLPQVSPQVALQVLAFCEQPRRSVEIQRRLNLNDRKNFQNNYLTPLLDAGYLARTIPAHPRSSRQRYVTTEDGRQWLANLEENDR